MEAGSAKSAGRAGRLGALGRGWCCSSSLKTTYWRIPSCSGKFRLCSGKAFTWLREAHARDGGQSALLHCPPLSVLISPKNTSTETPRVTFDQMPGHSGSDKFTHKKFPGTDALTKSRYLTCKTESQTQKQSNGIKPLSSVGEDVLQSPLTVFFDIFRGILPCGWRNNHSIFDCQNWWGHRNLSASHFPEGNVLTQQSLLFLVEHKGGGGWRQTSWENTGLSKVRWLSDGPFGGCDVQMCTLVWISKRWVLSPGFPKPFLTRTPLFIYLFLKRSKPMRSFSQLRRYDPFMERQWTLSVRTELF